MKKNIVKKIIVIGFLYSCNHELSNKNFISEDKINEVISEYSGKNNDEIIRINNIEFKKSEWEAKRLKYNDKDSSFLGDIYGLSINPFGREKYIAEKLAEINIEGLKMNNITTNTTNNLIVVDKSNKNEEWDDLKENDNASKIEQNISATINTIENPGVLNDVLYDNIKRLENINYTFSNRTSSSGICKLSLYDKVFEMRRFKQDPQEAFKFLKLFLDKGLELNSYEYGYEIRDKYKSFHNMKANPIKKLLGDSLGSDKGCFAIPNKHQYYDAKLDEIVSIKNCFIKYQNGEGTLTIEGCQNTGGKSSCLFTTYTIYYNSKDTKEKIPLLSKTTSMMDIFD